MNSKKQLGVSKVQKGGNNMLPINSKSKDARPKPELKSRAKESKLDLGCADRLPIRHPREDYSVDEVEAVITKKAREIALWKRIAKAWEKSRDHWFNKFKNSNSKVKEQRANIFSLQADNRARKAKIGEKAGQIRYFHTRNVLLINMNIRLVKDVKMWKRRALEAEEKHG